MLGKLGMRTEAYPFDFSRVTMDGLLLFLQKGFADGFYPSGPPPYRPECVGPWVLFRGQHTAFAHFDLNDSAVQQHFTRKIQRFEDLLDRPTTPVTFFRTVTAVHPKAELDMSATLEATIAARNPRLDFRIVLIVHDQGLLMPAVAMAPLSPRMTLWAISYSGEDDLSLFDRTQDSYRVVMQQSAAEDRWPPGPIGVPPPAVGMAAGMFDAQRRIMQVDRCRQKEGIAFADLTVDRFPWRSHTNLALIDGVASVGGTCVGIGSTQMIRGDVEARRPPKCRFCGSENLHLAGKPFRSERPFTDDEDQLILIHLYKILTGGDKVTAVEQLAHEMQRGTFEVILRIQFLTNASTKIMET